MIKRSNCTSGLANTIGFILVISVVIVFLAYFTAEIVPNQASVKESQTNDRVYSQLFEVSDTILSNGDTNRRDSVLLETQTDYLYADSFKTAPPMNYQIDNSDQLEYEISGYNGTEVFLNGESGSSVTYESDKILLDPVLSQNDYSPMGLEHTVVHQDIISQQNIVNGDTITLPVINAEPNGFVTGNNLNVFIDTEEYTTTTVEVNNTDDFEVRLETQLSGVAWNNAFDDEVEDGYINEVRYVKTGDSETNDVILDFESNRDYTIKQAESDVRFN